MSSIGCGISVSVAQLSVQWRSQGGGGGGPRGPWPPPKLLVVNFPINLRCYVLLGCRVINVILAINIGDSAFFDIAALVRQFGGLRHHQQTESIDRLRRYLFRKSTLSPLIQLLASDMYIMVTHGITLSYD